jgi:hypothetical protein
VEKMRQTITGRPWTDARRAAQRPLSTNPKSVRARERRRARSATKETTCVPLCLPPTQQPLFLDRDEQEA